jgi:hypothetical protein
MNGSDVYARTRRPYAKWQGAHWVLAALADLGCPPGDHALRPLREQILDTRLAPSYYTEFEATAAEAGAAHAAARRAAKVLLVRRLAYRLTTGELIHPEFARLHYPLYWHYDVLGGLNGMAHLGLLSDERCADALDLLESLHLADGWPVHARYYRAAPDIALHHDSVDWGGTSSRRATRGSPQTPLQYSTPPAVFGCDDSAERRTRRPPRTLLHESADSPNR